MNLPSGLRSLTFGEDFNQSLQPVTWPSSLRSLSLGDAFNQSLENVLLPDSLQYLTFGSVLLALIRTVITVGEICTGRKGCEDCIREYGFVEGEALRCLDEVRTVRTKLCIRRFGA